VCAVFRILFEDDALCAAGEVCVESQDCSAEIPDFGGFDGGTTNFTNVSDLSNVSGVILENSGFGKINFTNNSINFAGLNLSAYVNISDAGIEINSNNPGMSRLNVPTRLSFYGISFTDPKTLRDGVDCVGCFERSYSGGIYVVDVPGFSIYEVVEGFVDPGSDPGGSPGSGPGGSPGTGTPPAGPAVNLSGDCYSQWSCTAWSDCVDGAHSKTCTDLLNCATPINKPNEIEGCEVEEEEDSDEGAGGLSLRDRVALYIGLPALVILLGVMVFLVVRLVRRRREKVAMVMAPREKRYF